MFEGKPAFGKRTWKAADVRDASTVSGLPTGVVRFWEFSELETFRGNMWELMGQTGNLQKCRLAYKRELKCSWGEKNIFFFLFSERIG